MHNNIEMKTMNLKTFLSILLLGIFSLASAQQQIVTLNNALQMAENNYPSLKQKQLLIQQSKENESLINTALYPQVNITGQAVYQSEVTSLEVPGFPSGFGQKPDNYNVGLEMRFPLTQFGTIATRKSLEQARTSVSVSQVDLDLQRIRERITTIFGNVLLQKENESILKVRLTDLDSQNRKVSIGVQNGAVLKSNQLVLESEILTTLQRIEDIKATIKGFTDELSILTAYRIDSSTKFELEVSQFSSQNINRPELRVFEAQKKVLDVQADLIKKEARPNLYLFGQGYYGRPGYNFLNTNMRLYGLGGVGLSWNLNTFLNQSKQQRILDFNKDIINTQQETFLLNLNASLAEKNAEIQKYQTVLLQDAQIVQNRQEIIRAARSQLENGVITSTEYLTELNALTTAQLNLTLHQVQLSVARAQYNILLGY
jgi:outer membrane protein TolC